MMIIAARRWSSPDRAGERRGRTGDNDLLRLRQVLELHPGQAEVIFLIFTDGNTSEF